MQTLRGLNATAVADRVGRNETFYNWQQGTNEVRTDGGAIDWELATRLDRGRTYAVRPMMMIQALHPSSIAWQGTTRSEQEAREVLEANTTYMHDYVEDQLLYRHSPPAGCQWDHGNQTGLVQIHTPQTRV
jgi:hypothetical protein